MVTPIVPKRRWRSSLAAAAWALSAAGCLAFGATLVYATYGEVKRWTRVVPPTPIEVTRDVVVKNAADDEGRRASFRILLFSDEFRWRINSYEALDTETGRPHFTPEMKTVLNDAREIICIGASSEEIPAGMAPDAGRAAEERRAARRAEQIAVWVRQAVSRPIPVRKLNVGHHARTGLLRDTADQRRVVIVLVLDSDDRTNLDQALRDAMKRETARAPVFETLLRRYSLSSGQSFTWVP